MGNGKQKKGNGKQKKRNGKGKWEMVSGKLLVLDNVDLVPTRRTSVLSLFNWRKFDENQDLISVRQSVREEGGRLEVG